MGCSERKGKKERKRDEKERIGNKGARQAVEGRAEETHGPRNEK